MSGLSGECLTASKGRAGVLLGSTVLSELHAESGILQLGKGIAAPAAFPAVTPYYGGVFLRKERPLKRGIEIMGKEAVPPPVWRSVFLCFCPDAHLVEDAQIVSERDEEPI